MVEEYEHDGLGWTPGPPGGYGAALPDYEKAKMGFAREPNQFLTKHEMCALNAINSRLKTALRKRNIGSKTHPMDGDRARIRHNGRVISYKIKHVMVDSGASTLFMKEDMDCLIQNARKSNARIGTASKGAPVLKGSLVWVTFVCTFCLTLETREAVFSNEVDTRPQDYPGNF